MRAMEMNLLSENKDGQIEIGIDINIVEAFEMKRPFHPNNVRKCGNEHYQMKRENVNLDAIGSLKWTSRATEV